MIRARGMPRNACSAFLPTENLLSPDAELSLLAMWMRGASVAVRRLADRRQSLRLTNIADHLNQLADLTDVGTESGVCS